MIYVKMYEQKYICMCAQQNILHVSKIILRVVSYKKYHFNIITTRTIRCLSKGTTVVNIGRFLILRIKMLEP